MAYLGNSLGIGSSAVSASAIPVIPANALLDENNNPILDESGDYILAD